jgi:predicted SnoaL-like aldol condensation-catalyzing enzyme
MVRILKFVFMFSFIITLWAQGKTLDNKKMMQNFIETIFNQRDLNRISDFVSPDYTEHANGITSNSVASLIKTVQFLEETADDFKLKIEQAISEEDRVMILWTYQGFNKEYKKTVTLSGVFIARIVDNKIAEGWQIFDNFTRMKQLGFEVVVPADSLSQ